MVILQSCQVGRYSTSKLSCSIRFWANTHTSSFSEIRRRRHYIDVIMTTMTFQITSLTVVYSTVYSDADQRKDQSSASLAFVWGIHREMTGEFPAQRASYAENVSIWWRHHGNSGGRRKTVNDNLPPLRVTGSFRSEGFAKASIYGTLQNKFKIQYQSVHIYQYAKPQV